MNSGIDRNEVIEIRKIPRGWKMVKLHELGEKHDSVVAGPFGSNLKVSDYRDEGVPIIRLQNIDRSRFLDKDIKYISEEKAKELQYHSFKAGDLLLAKLGDPIGKTCLAPQNMRNGIVVSDVVRVRISSEKAITQFMEFVLNCDYCTKQLNKQTIGTTRPRVNLTGIRELMIALPPPAEQQKITLILSKVDNLIQKTEEIIEQSQRLKKGLMQELLIKGIGHNKFKKTIWGNIPDEWAVMKLADVCIERSGILTGPFGSLLHQRDYRSEGIPIITVEHLKENRISHQDVPHVSEEDYRRLARYILMTGDIVFSRVGTVDRSALVTDYENGWLFSGRCLRIRPNQAIMDAGYLSWFFSLQSFKNYIRRIAVGATMPSLNTELLRNVEIIVPSLSEQKKIGKAISKVDAVEKIEIKMNETLYLFKKGLMQKLLTGKIRVKV